MRVSNVEVLSSEDRTYRLTLTPDTEGDWKYLELASMVNFLEMHGIDTSEFRENFSNHLLNWVESNQDKWRSYDSQRDA